MGAHSLSGKRAPRRMDPQVAPHGMLAPPVLSLSLSASRLVKGSSKMRLWLGRNSLGEFCSAEERRWSYDLDELQSLP
jgi:hypothetical protein